MSFTRTVRSDVQPDRPSPHTFEATPAAIDEKLLQEAVAYYQSASTEFKNGPLHAPFLDQ